LGWNNIAASYQRTGYDSAKTASGIGLVDVCSRVGHLKLSASTARHLYVTSKLVPSEQFEQVPA